MGDWLLQQKWLHCGINRHCRRSSDVILRHFVEVSKYAVILLSVYYVCCYLVYIYSMLWPCLLVRTMASAWLASTRAVVHTRSKWSITVCNQTQSHMP